AFQFWNSRRVASLRSMPAPSPSFTQARLTRSAGLSSVSAHFPLGALVEAGIGMAGRGYVTDSAALTGENSSARAAVATKARAASTVNVRSMSAPWISVPAVGVGVAEHGGEGAEDLLLVAWRRVRRVLQRRDLAA